MPTVCAPWPGKRNAVATVPPSFVHGSDHRGDLQLLNDQAVEFGAGVAGRQLQRVLDGPVARAAVADDADAVDAQQRSPAKLAVIVAVEEVLERLFGLWPLDVERPEDLFAGHL